MILAALGGVQHHQQALIEWPIDLASNRSDRPAEGGGIGAEVEEQSRHFALAEILGLSGQKPV